MAEEVRKKYNPRDLSPFPYQNVERLNKDLTIKFFSFNENDLSRLSGAILFNEKEERYSIFINSDRPTNRQNFTLAHELGHYFLHKDILKKEGIIVDDGVFENNRALFRPDIQPAHDTRETEANKFAAALLMPEELLRKAWKDLGGVEECAEVFNVSVSAMSIRLERLGILK